MDLYKFLKNEEKDFQGRFLSDVWSFTDDEIEYNHDTINLSFFKTLKDFKLIKSLVLGLH